MLGNKLIIGVNYIEDIYHTVRKFLVVSTLHTIYHSYHYDVSLSYRIPSVFVII